MIAKNDFSLVWFDERERATQPVLWHWFKIQQSHTGERVEKQMASV